MVIVFSGGTEHAFNSVELGVEDDPQLFFSLLFDCGVLSPSSAVPTRCSTHPNITHVRPKILVLHSIVNIAFSKMA